MRRLLVPLVVAAVIVLGLGFVVPRGLPLAVAQDAPAAASPTAEDELPPGVTSEFIAAGSVADLPPTPAFMVLIRLTLEPGAVLPADANDPSGAFIVVEAGTPTIRLDGPSATESTLGPGDSVYGPPFTAGEIRNDGQEPVVLLLAIIGPEGVDADESGAATPAA